MILCDIICRLYVSPQWAGTSWHMERVHLSAELRKRRDVALLSYLHHLLWNSECLMETCCANFRVHNLALGLQALMLKKHIAPSTKFPVSSDWPAHKHLSQHRSPCIRAWCNKSHRGQPTRCFQAFQEQRFNVLWMQADVYRLLLPTAPCFPACCWCWTWHKKKLPTAKAKGVNHLLARIKKKNPAYTHNFNAQMVVLKKKKQKKNTGVKITYKGTVSGTSSFVAFPYLVSRGMLLLSTQLLWSCAWSVLELVSAPWLPWLAWHRVGMVFLCRLTWV